MTGALNAYLRAQSPLPLEGYPARREGRMCRFDRRPSLDCGRPRYNVIAVRGGLFIGELQFRNQWGYYSFHAHPEARFNKEILGEIYAMLRELKS